MGREDRLVRVGITLSLALMGGFAVLASGSVGAAPIAFAVLGAYLVLTALIGWEPLYARIGLDTGRHDHRSGEATGAWDDEWLDQAAWPAHDVDAESDIPVAHEIDLRDGVPHAADRNDA